MNSPIQSKATDKQRQILTIAQPIILGKGFSAVGLNEILKTAGVPKGSFYHYFESKEQFGCALVDHYFEQYLTNLDRLLSDTKLSATARLLTYFEQWKTTQCDDTSQDKCLVVKLSGEVTDLSEGMRLALKKGTQAVIDRLSLCLAEAAKENKLNLGNTKTVTEELYYLWIGATLMTKVHNHPQMLEVAMHALESKLNLHQH